MTRSLLQKLPYFVSHFLGYRKPNHVPKVLPLWRIYFWSFLAAWIGIALLEIIFTYSRSFQSHHTPIIIASFGASAVLVYGVIESPLAQPRNVICGQIIGSVVGVIIAQLFLNIQHNWASEGQRVAVEWVGGATVMALALTLMQVTKTVHPPGGATALIAVITPNIVDISWFYIGVVTLSAVMQVTVGCLVNNVERRYPQYWWTPHKPIQIDPATVSTVMPDLDEPEKEDVVADNLTSAEEGRLNSNSETSVVGLAVLRSSASSSLTAIETTVDHAIFTLQKHANHSQTRYTLISPGIPLVVTPGLLDDSEEVTLNRLLQKLNTNKN